MSYCPLIPNCWAPASLQRLTWKLNELVLQQWEQCPIFRAKQGTVVLTAPLLGRPFVTQCFLLRVEAVAGVNLKSKITFSFENTADMPSQQGSVSSLFLSCFVFHETKDLPLQWSKIWGFIFNLTKQECILPLSHIGEHLFPLSFGFESMGNFIILSVKKHPVLPGWDIKPRSVSRVKPKKI